MLRYLCLIAALLATACSRPGNTSDTPAVPGQGAVEALAGAEAPELDWLEMLPPEELAALERGDGPEVEHRGNRQMPQYGTFRTVASVLERPVRLPGYVVPLGMADDGRLSEFLFVPYYGACIHVPPPPPNQIVHVRLAAPIPMPDMYSPFFLSGQLHAERIDDDLAGSAYTMRNPGLSAYEP